MCDVLERLGIRSLLFVGDSLTFQQVSQAMEVGRSLSLRGVR